MSIFKSPFGLNNKLTHISAQWNIIYEIIGPVNGISQLKDADFPEISEKTYWNFYYNHFLNLNFWTFQTMHLLPKTKKTNSLGIVLYVFRWEYCKIIKNYESWTWTEFQFVEWVQCEYWSHEKVENFGIVEQPISGTGFRNKEVIKPFAIEFNQYSLIGNNLEMFLWNFGFFNMDA